jgi:hypothetical protein
VLLTHDAANAALDAALARRGDAPVRDLAAAELPAAIASAALLEARLTAVEWTQIALLALSGTQARAPRGHAILPSTSAGHMPGQIAADSATWAMYCVLAPFVPLHSCPGLAVGPPQGWMVPLARTVATLVARDLQGCLGWDRARERRQGSYSATVTPDKWFVLATRTQHAIAALATCRDLTAAELAPAAVGGEGAAAALGATRLAEKLSDGAESLQGTRAAVCAKNGCGVVMLLSTC